MTQFKVKTKVRKYFPFTPEVQELIREVYPSRGVRGVRTRLQAMGWPDHPSGSIRHWCSANDVRFVGIGSEHAKETQLAWVRAGENQEQQEKSQ